MAVNYTDFDKVWASASPLTPYEFSDNNYRQGWNFVGATPPSRQMWDAFMKHADEKLKYLYDHEDIPVGHEYFTMNPNIPQGSLPLLGGEYSRETYSALWTWVQQQTGYLKTEAEWQALSLSNNGNVPYYSDGDGSTTFRVPSLHCWIKGSDGSAQLVGSYLAAGLPNIVAGTICTQDWGSIETQMTGAWVEESHGVKATNVDFGTSSDEFIFTFDASHSNSIYGNSNTVQPESIVGMWLVKCYGTVADTGTINEKAYMDEQLALNVPVGCVQAYAGQTTPQGWLLCDGSAISRTQYNKLFGVIGTSYGAGDGTDTFNLPNLTDKFIQGNATSGTEHSAGLPNITGTAYDVLFGGRQAGTGALSDTNRGDAQNLQNGEGDSSWGTIVFDAHDSNSIYGNSTTVQPPALTMRYIIKY